MLSIATASSVASAQSFRLDRFRAAERGSDGFATRRLLDFGGGPVSLQLTGDYAHEPLVLEDSVADELKVVEHELVADLTAGFALGRHVFLFVGLDAPLVMTGEDVPTPLQPLASEADGAGIGDAHVGARFRIAGDDDSTVRFGLDTRMGIPLAEFADDDQSYRGDETVTFAPALVLELDFGAFGISANAGALVRDEVTWSGTTVGSEATYALAASVVAAEWLTLYLEGYGALGFEEFGETKSLPLEALLGAKAYGSSGFGGGVAVGTGLISGLGSPDLRVVAQIGYAPKLEKPAPEPEIEPEAPPPPSDRDGDGVLDSADRCPDEAEDKDGHEDEDGCPDNDNDGDGVLDPQDQCRDDAEDVDRFEDEDGCPDPDNDKDGIADSEDACPLEVGPASLNGCPAAKIDTASNQIEISEQVQFATGKDSLLPESDAILEAVRAVLADNPQVLRLRVEGHTDDVGKPARNLELSKRRANTVLTWLVAHGIHGARLEAWGCGDTVPAVANDSDGNRALNRRVIFALAEMQDETTAAPPPAATCKPAKK